MRFWDTSAVVPLLLEQEATKIVDALRSDDPEMAAWWGTPTECVSAVARLRREDRLTLSGEERVLDLLGRLRADAPARRRAPQPTATASPVCTRQSPA